MPVRLYLVDAIPLTAVGKVFKPAQHAVAELLATLAPAGASVAVAVAAHPEHGSLITVAWSGVAQAERAELARQTDERLDPLTMRHVLVWR